MLSSESPAILDGRGVELLPKIRIERVVPDQAVTRAVETIAKAVKGGQGGFVLKASQSKNLEHFPVNLSVAG